METEVCAGPGETLNLYDAGLRAKSRVDAGFQNPYPSGFLIRAVANCHAYGLFRRALVKQLSNFANQLSIFPTATLPFVILFPGKKHAADVSHQQDRHENSRWKAVDSSADGCRNRGTGLRFGRTGFKRGRQ